MLGDITIKKSKIWNGNLYGLTRNKMWYDNHNYMCHICAKEVLDLKFRQVVTDKIIVFFTKLPQISHAQKKK